MKGNFRENFMQNAQFLKYFGKKRVKVLKGENMHLKLILRIITKEIEYKLGIKYI